MPCAVIDSIVLREKSDVLLIEIGLEGPRRKQVYSDSETSQKTETRSSEETEERTNFAWNSKGTARPE
jgi:hypothetical protein